MNKIIIFILFFFVSVAWGTTWIAMKIATETIPPLFATGTRFLLAFPLLIILCYLKKSPLLFPRGQRWFQVFISIFYFSIPFALMLYGGSCVNSFISSIIFANMPVAILIVSSILLKQKLSLVQIIGIIISIMTLFIILTFELRLDFFKQFEGILCLLLALFSHSVIYVQCQKKFYNISILTFHTLSSLMSGISLLLIALFLENPNIHNFSIQSFISILYLAYFPGVCGMLSYFYLQKKINSFYASIVFLIFPFISGFLEYYFYQYDFYIYKIYYFFLLIFGISLTLIPIKKNI